MSLIRKYVQILSILLILLILLNPTVLRIVKLQVSNTFSEEKIQQHKRTKQFYTTFLKARDIVLESYSDGKIWFIDPVEHNKKYTMAEILYPLVIDKNSKAKLSLLIDKTNFQITISDDTGKQRIVK